MKKITTKELVQQHQGALASMNNAELLVWSRENGLNSAPAFSAFKKALLEIGIDYSARRSVAYMEKVAVVERAAAKTVILYSDAKARTDRFAICDQDGKAVWYGKFFDNDRDYNGEQSSGEMAAAKKAVWLAAQVAREVGEAVRLVLRVDAKWLCFASHVAYGTEVGGKARELGDLALKMGVALEMEHVPGTENPADKYTVTTGFQSYKQVALSTLITRSEVA